jgi:hypothetical protein
LVCSTSGDEGVKSVKGNDTMSVGISVEKPRYSGLYLTIYLTSKVTMWTPQKFEINKKKRTIVCLSYAFYVHNTKIKPTYHGKYGKTIG